MAQNRIAFRIRRFAQLLEGHRFFSLEPDDFSLLSPNTGNCPIFRTQADAELTKAIYRRVPVLWREAANGQAEVNPWRLSFKAMFHMANDSPHFRTAEELKAEGSRHRAMLCRIFSINFPSSGKRTNRPSRAVTGQRSAFSKSTMRCSPPNASGAPIGQTLIRRRAVSRPRA
jgi:hypothetical protein